MIMSMFLQGKQQILKKLHWILRKYTSPSSETSLAKTHNKNQESIEKESLTKSKTDNTEPTVSEVQTNILESEKINVLSSENSFANLSVEKAKDSAGAELIPPKDTSPSSETSLAKIHDPVEESIEKESLTNSQTDNTEPTASEDSTNILES